MKKIKFKYTVDALTVCYLADAATIDYLNAVKSDYGFENFRLYRKENPTGKFDNEIQVTVQNPNDSEYMHFGDLYYDEGRHDKEGGNTYVWFRVENKVFYTPFLYNTNILLFANTIAGDLNLTANNITTLDIACDSNVNWSRRIKRAIFDENLLPIVNRKAYDNEREQIQGLRFSYGCNQLKMNDLSLYIKQNTKDGGFELKGYDKGTEIAASKKEYIKKWLESIKNPHRLEIHLKNEHIREFCANSPLWHQHYFNQRQIPPSVLLESLSDSNHPLFEIMFMEYANRLIHFRDKTTGQELSIFEV
ncbi:hypothetical protein AGMMS4957_03730 [Bacteroidia bacterium]|nr:hypothetical protein AGMMS4957_03550 [Bacteroidia bacterium]GHT19448.1 hypothetical protein AGMMS4957_03730 [Bacteroidia bacterium]